jgi:hypothetical protein
MERQEVRISSQDERIAKQQEITERALSLDEDRAAKREWRTLAIKSADRIIETGARLGPSIVKSLTGKDLLPGGDPPEVIALRDFFKSKEEGGLLTEEQAGAAFGIWDGQEPHALKKPGVLSEAQGQVLAKVAQGEAPPSELDKLVPGGEHEITLLQAGRLQSECGFDVQLQLLPLLALFQARQTVKGVAGGKK